MGSKEVAHRDLLKTQVFLCWTNPCDIGWMWDAMGVGMGVPWAWVREGWGVPEASRNPVGTQSAPSRKPVGSQSEASRKPIGTRRVLSPRGCRVLTPRGQQGPSGPSPLESVLANHAPTLDLVACVA